MMMARARLGVVTAGLLGLVSSRATAQKLIEVPPIEVHTLVSREVGDSFRIQVLLPPMIPGEGTRFPVLYLTDIDGDFMGADILRMMMLGDTPRFIAVGIGYPGVSGLMQALALRARDLTPVPVENANAGNQMPIAGTRKPAVANGGGPKFLSFIRQELIPFIDARYPTDPADRGYWGDSLGGLFGCYVLFTAPETFQRYIIGSPSAWWADEQVIGTAQKYLDTHADLAARVFMGVGALEEVGPEAAHFRMVTNVLRLERMLRDKKYPSLQLATHIFPDESHTTVAMMNLIRGLVSVYGRPAPDKAFMAEAVAEIMKQQKPK